MNGSGQADRKVLSKSQHPYISAGRLAKAKETICHSHCTRLAVRPFCARQSLSCLLLSLMSICPCLPLSVRFKLPRSALDRGERKCKLCADQHYHCGHLCQAHLSHPLACNHPLDRLAASVTSTTSSALHFTRNHLLNFTAVYTNNPILFLSAYLLLPLAPIHRQCGQ